MLVINYDLKYYTVHIFSRNAGDNQISPQLFQIWKNMPQICDYM